MTATYAGGRRILDADSHVMELADFLDDHIDPAFRDRLRRRGMEALQPVLDGAVRRAEERRADEEKAAEAEARLLHDKGWTAMGAFDPAERSRVLDLFGFEGQLVFATFATSMFAGRDVDRLYAGAAAQNKAVAAFCSSDPRLLAVAYVPLVDPARAAKEVADAIDVGCQAVMVPSTAAGDRAPTHPDLDGVWDTLAEANVPFVLHVGGGGRLLDPAFHNNDMPVTDHLGGGENIRSKDFLAIHHSPELFLGALVYDGIFDRFPKLRGGCIEQGAGWVPSWMRHLDYGLRAFKRTEEPLRRLQDRPSEYVRRHLKFTPFPGEDVGWMIEQAGPEMFMFSTDFPHPEGGKDPLAKFEEAMGDTDDDARDRFYYRNMAELLHGAVVPA
ncbi:MAG TPA: amidohydrolase family protein [Acidimicrobiales bacterium]|nr:amidohydrolase family protein [Acidimicrobiales bacterium]